MCHTTEIYSFSIEIGVFIIGLVAIIGFFITKTKGYGRYTISALLILVVIVLASFLFISGKIEKEMITNLFFAVIGFAGGLFTTNKEEVK